MSGNLDEIIGELEIVLGDGEAKKPAFDPTFLVNAAAELANRGVSYGLEKKAYEDTQRDDAASSLKAIAADNTLALSEAAFDRAPSSDATRIAKDAAYMASDEAAQNLSAGAQSLRLVAANKALQAAAQAAQKAPKDPAAQARLRAWQKVVARVRGAGGGGAASASAALAQTPIKIEEPSFFMAVRAGLPTWGWFGIGGLVLAAGTTAVVMLRKGR